MISLFSKEAIMQHFEDIFQLFIYGVGHECSLLQNLEEGIRCPGLEFQVVSSCLMRVWGSELRSHGRAPTVIN